PLRVVDEARRGHEGFELAAARSRGHARPHRRAHLDLAGGGAGAGGPAMALRISPSPLGEGRGEGHAATPISNQTLSPTLSQGRGGERWTGFRELQASV